MTDGWTAPGFFHVRELGGGATGQIVQAVDDVTGSEVAIKYLSDRLLADHAFVTRFREESRLLAHLEDPNLVDFYDYVESPTEGRAAVIMELVDGVSLRKVLATQGPAGPLGALAVLSGSLLAMAAVHQAGIAHRDYKPANVLIRRDGVSKVLDVGIASRAGGAPLYLAPEQWLGAPPDQAADLYAATAVFFECLTGGPPFPERSSMALEKAHRSGPVPIESVPGPLRHLVAAGLAKNPADRPASAAEFLGHLEDAAVEAYGPAWEAQGRGRLAEMTALASMTDWTPPAPAPSSPQPATSLRSGKRGAHRGSIVLGVSAVTAIAVAAGVALWATSGGSGHQATDTGRTLSPAPASSGTRTKAPRRPVTPDGVAAQISRAVAEKKTASFAYRRTATATDATSATGVFRVTSKTTTVYDMTVWNPAGGPESNKKLRTILVGGVAYVASGGWHSAPAVRVPARRDAPHLYGSLAANTRWATSTSNILALLRASTSVKVAPWTPPGGTATGTSYTGVAAAAKLGREQTIAPLYDQYPDGRFRVSYILRVGADHLPQRLDVKLQPVAAPGKPTAFHIVYSRWGRKAAITAPV
ncbi:serine/threonine-protein kinase [Actinomadura scrupuli]|uniref:serine/threonine-protein kinase n=1 Tax=Actinomadura scrupuli TaxID=559629 RepID=UPI003D99D88C